MYFSRYERISTNGEPRGFHPEQGKDANRLTGRNFRKGIRYRQAYIWLVRQLPHSALTSTVRLTLPSIRSALPDFADTLCENRHGSGSRKTQAGAYEELNKELSKLLQFYSQLDVPRIDAAAM